MPRSGRPRKNDNREDHRIIRHIECHEKEILQVFTKRGEQGKGNTSRTARRRLRLFCFRSRKHESRSLLAHTIDFFASPGADKKSS